MSIRNSKQHVRYEIKAHGHKSCLTVATAAAAAAEVNILTQNPRHDGRCAGADDAFSVRSFTQASDAWIVFKIHCQGQETNVERLRRARTQNERKRASACVSERAKSQKTQEINLFNEIDHDVREFRVAQINF